jgi:hypothetical protein
MIFIARELEIFKQLGDILHVGHMEMVAFLENFLLEEDNLHLGRGNWAIYNMRYLGCLHGGLYLNLGFLGCNNVDVGGVDLVESMA